MKSPESWRDRSNRRNERTSIDIVPLIDIIFLLLAFFMFLTMSMVVRKGIDVNLAIAESGDTAKEPLEIVVVTVDEDGDLYWNEEQITKEELLEKLQTRSEQEQAPSIHLKADRNVRHHRIIDVVDVLRRADVDDLVFSVEPTS